MSIEQKFNLRKEDLYNLYWNDKTITLRRLAKILKVSYSDLLYWFKKYNIKRKIRHEVTKGQNRPKLTEYNKTYSSKKLKRLWQNPEYREIFLKNIRKTAGNESIKNRKRIQFTILNKDLKFQKKRFIGLLKRPTKPEKKIIEITNKYNLPYKYVGNGEVIINGFCPDFINYNGEKKIIEIFGDYWHNIKNNIERDKIRIKTYSDYGFDTLIIWEHELLKNKFGKILSEQEIINKINNF